MLEPDGGRRSRVCLEFCAHGRGAACSSWSQVCSKTWRLTHNPNSLSEITLNHLAKVLLAAFWVFSFTFSHRGWFGAHSVISAQLGGVSVRCECPTPKTGGRSGRQREESIDLSKFTLKSYKKCDLEPLSAQDTCWTALISLLWQAGNSKICFSLELWKHVTKSATFAFQVILLLQEKKITPNPWKTTATITRKKGKKNPAPKRVTILTSLLGCSKYNHETWFLSPYLLLHKSSLKTALQGFVFSCSTRSEWKGQLCQQNCRAALTSSGTGRNTPVVEAFSQPSETKTCLVSSFIEALNSYKDQGIYYRLLYN